MHLMHTALVAGWAG
ncbi:hypothetical protein, partial [Chamaesiphon sp. GL140_3_metabinner_50]